MPRGSKSKKSPSVRRATAILGDAPAAPQSVEEKIQLLRSRKSHLFGDLLNEETFDIGLVNDESTAGGTAASKANSISGEDFSFLIDV